MSGSDDQNVTIAEVVRRMDHIEKRVEKLPTTHQVRFLVLAGLIATRFIPAQDVAHNVAQAAIGWIT